MNKKKIVMTIILNIKAKIVQIIIKKLILKI